MNDGQRWILRSFVPRPRSLIFPVAIVVSLAVVLSLPGFAGRLDRRGLPGGWIALALVVVLIVPVVWSLSTIVPRARRRREVLRWARGREAPFRSAFRIPLSLGRVNSLRGLSTPGGVPLHGGVAHLVVVREGDDEVLVFDRWRAETAGYQDAEWRTAAALRVDLDAPPLVVHPHHHPFRAPLGETPLRSVNTEWGEFDRRFQVLAHDRAAATALVDARLMAWLLDGPIDLTYEVADAWLVCSAPMGPASQRDGLIEAVLGLRDHLPRVTVSMFPAHDPGRTPRP
jgi:hypothetical protein